MDAEVSTHTFLTMIIEESVFHVVWTNFFLQLFLRGTQNIYIYFFINWTLCMSDNLPERVQILGHAHIICITLWKKQNYLLSNILRFAFKTAFERIFNVMQLILVKIKWKYLIQKFHDICFSYYFKSILIKKEKNSSELACIWKKFDHDLLLLDKWVSFWLIYYTLMFICSVSHSSFLH